MFMKKLFSLCLLSVLIGIFSTNVFAEEFPFTKHTVQEWDSWLLFNYDMNLLQAFVIDDLFSSKRTVKEKHRVIKAIVEFMTTVENDNNDDDDEYDPLDNDDVILISDLLAGSDNFLRYYTESLNDDFIKIKLSSFLDVVGLLDLYLDQKKSEYVDIVALLNAFVGRLITTYDEDAQDLSNFDAAIAKNIKKLMLNSAWYKKSKNTKKVKNILLVLDMLIQNQDKVSADTLISVAASLSKEFTNASKVKTSTTGTKQISFYQYKEDSFIKNIIKKYCTEKVILNMYSRVLRDPGDYDTISTIELVVDSAELTGESIASIVFMIRNTTGNLNTVEIPEDVIWPLLKRLDPKDKRTMMSNLADLLHLINSNNMNGAVLTGDFSWTDVEFAGREQEFDANFSNTMITFFKKYQNQKIEKVSLYFISLFTEYLIKNEIDTATPQVVLDILQKSDWFQNLNKSKDKKGSDKIKEQIKILLGRMPCSYHFKIKKL